MRFATVLATAAVALTPVPAVSQLVAAPAGAVPLARAAQPPRRVPPGTGLEAELRAASPYVGWGALAGGAVGLAYGLAHARELSVVPGIPVLAVAYTTVVGGAAGGVGGAVVYVVRRAARHARPTASR